MLQRPWLALHHQTQQLMVLTKPSHPLVLKLVAASLLQAAGACPQPSLPPTPRAKPTPATSAQMQTSLLPWHAPRVPRRPSVPPKQSA